MLKKMKIRSKLLICFVIAVIIASISGIVGVIVLIKTDANYSKALVENGFSQGEIGAFNTYLNKGGAVVRDIIMLTEKEDIQAAQDELTDIAEKSNKALEDLKPNCTTEAEKELIAKIETLLVQYREERDKVIELGLQSKNTEALDQFRTQARPVLNEMMQYAQQLADDNKVMGTEVSAGLSRSSTVAIILMIIGIIAAFIIALIFAAIVAGSIAKPIIRVQEASAKLEKGDLNIELDSDNDDEVGMMTRSFHTAAGQIRCYINDISRGLASVASGNFNITPEEVYQGDFKEIEASMITIITKLSETMGQIDEAAEQVSAGSGHVSAGAQGLSQGTTEQASSIEELAATIAEITKQVEATANHALKANELSGDAGKEVEACNGQMHEMNAAMENISQASGEINKIIKTIEDIAFQTNILALNAAVEAARAGEAGKGFAVVADEVRNLASKSAEAARNTTALIEGAILAVENGTRISEQTTENLQRVVERTYEVSSTIDKISSATGEQSSSLKEVTIGIDQIASVVQTNSATAEESAAASEELSGQAEVLKNLMNQFQLLQNPNM